MKGVIRSHTPICTPYRFRKLSAFVGAMQDAKDIKNILSAEGYWDLKKMRPTEKGYRHAVAGNKGNIFLWEKDFMQSLMKSYSMQGRISDEVKTYVEIVRLRHELFFEQKEKLEDFNATTDLLNVAGEEIKTQIRIWGISKNTSFAANLERVNKWINFKCHQSMKISIVPKIRLEAMETSLLAKHKSMLEHYVLTMMK